MWLRRLCRSRAEQRPERLAYSFLASSGELAQELSYGDLDRQARALANLLLTRTGQGARIVLSFEPGLDFVVALFACVYAGRVAVPMAAPRLRGAACERLRSAWLKSEAELVLTHAAVLARSAWSEAGISARSCIDLDAARAQLHEDVPLAAEAHSDYVFIQYTSGSTSEPKGVAVTYDSLADNLRHIQRCFRHRPDTVGVGWLPMHHDMGLVGSVLEPMHTGFRAILMSPLDFVQRPARWLQAIHRYGAEVSGGPTFGYEHCAQRVTEAQSEQLDLSSWNLAFVGAETVRADVLDAFARRFAKNGFQRKAFFPCYGMAEATLMISGAKLHSGPQLLQCSGEALRQGRLARDPQGDRLLVGCGEPVDGHRLYIVDPATGIRCADGIVGEIWVSGPSVAAGYWQAATLSEEAFKATIAGEDGVFLRTGDIGCLVDGQVFITTRLKTMIVLRGVNIAPEDVEAAAQSASDDLVTHGGAAFAVEGAGAERLILVQELSREAIRGAKSRALRLAVVEAIVRGLGVSPEVHFVLPGTVPRTTSGKIQRLKTRELFVSGELTSALVVDAFASGAEQASEALS
jgi:acyl-CoA synthetase (AMP-forming)/AMP-acid ligase II